LQLALADQNIIPTHEWNVREIGTSVLGEVFENDVRSGLRLFVDRSVNRWTAGELL
jgi:hypothetical protein